MGQCHGVQRLTALYLDGKCVSCQHDLQGGCRLLLTWPKLRLRGSWQVSAGVASPVGLRWLPNRALAVSFWAWERPTAFPQTLAGCCCLSSLARSLETACIDHQMITTHWPQPI